MSGNNQNTYAESRRMILGVGDLYIEGVYVGNLKGSVTFKYKREYAEQRGGNNIAPQKAEVTGEEASLDAEICDLKLSQLRRAFGIVQAVGAVAAHSVQKREVVQVVASGSSVSLGETPVIGATNPFKVTSLDRKTTYVSGTDYSVATNTFTFISGGTLTVGQYVAVEYSFSDAGAQSLAAGGETKAVPTFRMDYVVRDDAGKAWQLTFFKAYADTDLKLAFHDRESGDYAMHNIGFRALVDITKPEGGNLLEITQEDAAS